MSNVNLAVLPEELHNLDLTTLKKLLLCETNIENFAPKIRQANKKRVKELLEHKSVISVESTIEDALNRLKDPEMLVLTFEDLKYLLEYYDTAYANWHAGYGLPKKLVGCSDLLVMTYEVSSPNSGEYLQDYCLLGIKENGYYSPSHLIENQIHIDCIWMLH